ncbi:unnamed protein product [Orchesella dallaii]|uniref:FAD linked oxidase N-terminal domain-containing protein n=1 Tax=Orchesella dallaii TaxID=48710 RepID=A0ABP1R4M4_9HEXA
MGREKVRRQLGGRRRERVGRRRQRGGRRRQRGGRRRQRGGRRRQRGGRRRQRGGRRTERVGRSLALLVFGSTVIMLHFFSLAAILFLGYPISGTLGSIPSTILEDVNYNKSSVYFAPENVEDLEIIFEVATAYNITIRQLISRETEVKSNKSWQWNENNTNEILVDTSNFNYFEYDKISGHARVGAGLSLFNLTEKLHNLGRGLLRIPPQADVTVGAAILKGDHS